MKLSYSQEKYQYWADFNSVSFTRKLENETAFDGIVKIYSLKTGDEGLNQKLKGHFFGNFIFPTEKGVFLRMFENKNSWPTTNLVHLNLKTFHLEYLNNNDSSWNVWVGKKLKNGYYAIDISPTESLEFHIS